MSAVSRRFLWASVAVLCVSCWTVAAAAQEEPFLLLEGPYLGQEPPGLEPEIFAPGIVTTGESEAGSVFFHDGRKFLFKRWKPLRSVYFMEEKDGRWTQPQLTRFTGKGSFGDFTFAPDGKRMYVTSNWPLQEGGEYAEAGSIWRLEWTGAGWSEAHPLPHPINTEEHQESYPSVTADGTLYFFSRDRGGYGLSDILRSRWVDGKYTEPENLGALINTEHHEWDPFVAPDESYLIFCSKKPEGLGEDDLYVTFRRDDGSWTTPANMGQGVNSSASDNRPYVTLDGKYFFFNSSRKVDGFSDLEEALRPGNGNRDIYWVDAKIIEQFRPK